MPTGGAEHRAFLEQVITTVRLMGQESFAAAYLGYLAELHAGAGEVPRALECVGEALRWWRETGRTSTPELLRHRARYSWPPARTGLAVADLRRRCASRHQGGPGPRLRAAVELARVPLDSRPDDWRTVLAEARGDLSPTPRLRDTAAADDLLAT